MNKRNPNLDVAKGIGIILVVLAHAGMPYATITNRFHMAFFFFLSGMTVSDKYLDNIKMIGLFLWKRVKGLYIPFVVFNVLFYLFYNQLIKINIITDNPKFLESPAIGGGNAYGIVTSLSSSDIISRLVNVFKFQGEFSLGGALWFLRVLFGVACTWAILNWVLKALMHFSDNLRMKINIAVGITFVMLAFSLEQNGIAFLYGQYETVMASYLMYVMGLYCARIKLETSWINETVIMILAFVLLNLCNNVCYMLSWNCSVNQMGNPYMFLITSTLGTVFGYFLARILVKIKICMKVLSWFGQNSLYILLFQFTAFKVITLIECYVYNQPLYRVASFPVMESGRGWWVAYSIAGLVIPAIIGTIWNQIKNKINFT